MIIKWEEINSVNVKEIDAQHQKLVAIINQLFSVNKESKADIKLIIDELVEYADYHLRFEEELFTKFKYENSVDHKYQHDMYRQKVSEFREKLTGDNYQQVFAELTQFLRDWWIFHINNADAAYSECFNQNGLY
jgi:hemerythrin-like metal-binding protein